MLKVILRLIFSSKPYSDFSNTRNLTTTTMVSEKPLKIKSASRKKPSRSALGAPSQHTQSSRKGKKAWRKNVDIGEVEQALEDLRQEERVTGYAHLVVHLFDNKV